MTKEQIADRLCNGNGILPPHWLLDEVETLIREAEAAARADERDALDELVDEECAKLQTDDKSLDYWHGVGAAATALEAAIRARGETTSPAASGQESEK